MSLNLLNLRRTKVKDDGQFARRLNETFNDLIIQLRKEREKNRRLVAAIRKLAARERALKAAQTTKGRA